MGAGNGAALWYAVSACCRYAGVDGIEGISDLYRQIGKMLGCENAVERVLQEEYERVAARYQELGADFAKYKFCLIAHGIAYLPDALRVYQQDYGLPITKICIIMNPPTRQKQVWMMQ